MSGLALIDADLYLYRAAAGAVRQVEWGPDVWTYLCDHQAARNSFEELLDWVHEQLPDHDQLLCWGASTNFRYAFMPSYKAARRKQVRPAGYGELREWAMGAFPSADRPALEGDDVVGILSNTPGAVIVSGDKDMKQLPGQHLQQDGSFLQQDQHAADLCFYLQALTGDHTDGYPGCPGIGPARGLKLLEPVAGDEEQLWRQVVNTYRKAGATDRTIIANALCARILHPGDIDDSDPHTIRYWRPPIALEDIPPP